MYVSKWLLFKMQQKHQKFCILRSRIYVTNDKGDIESYNNQPVEIDAHAFAAIIMTDLFGLNPTFDSLSDVKKSLIKKRISEIVKENGGIINV